MKKFFNEFCSFIKFMWIGITLIFIVIMFITIFLCTLAIIGLEGLISILLIGIIIGIVLYVANKI